LFATPPAHSHPFGAGPGFGLTHGGNPAKGGRMRRGLRSPVDKSEEKTSPEVTDGKKGNPTG